jgi:hypothetical protein
LCWAITAPLTLSRSPLAAAEFSPKLFECDTCGVFFSSGSQR